MRLIAAGPRLQALAAVEAAGSFSGAAAALGVSQSAVSQHVAALERQVGAGLVDRGARPVQLTPAGHVLAEHARAVVARLDAAERDLLDVLGRQERRLRLGSVPTALASFVPGAIARLRAELPDRDLRGRGRAVRQLAVALPASDYRTHATTRMTELLRRATRARR